MPTTGAMWVAAWYVAAGVVTGVVYWRDKAAARRGGWRVRGLTLHLLELAGGCAGAVVARWSLRHKTRDVGFLVVSYAILAAHVAGWGIWVWWKR